MGDDVVHAVGRGEVHGLQGLRHRSNLIELHEHGVGCPKFDALRQAFRLCDEEVVSDRLNAVAVGFGERSPTSPVILTKPVLNGKNGVIVQPTTVHFNQIIG